MRSSELNFATIGLIVLTFIVLFFGGQLLDWTTAVPHGNDLLFAGAVGGNVADIEHAIGEGADVDARTRTNVTALMLACNNGHRPAVQALLARGADPNADAGHGISPMYNAILADDPGIMTLLIEAGAETDTLLSGQSLLDVANRLNSHAAASFLRQRGVKSAGSLEE